MTYSDTEIDHVAIELAQGEKVAGHFLQLMGQAYQLADPVNKNLLRPVMETLIENHGLERLFNYEYGIDKGERRVEANL